MDRHYGMDWLRIGAFGLLILYHIAMVFVPWNYHVKAAHVADWVAIPMLAVNAWRLSLLFVVSGFASRALFLRSSGIGEFIRNRSFRLLVPLAFGVAIIVPPQPWVELTTKYGYTHGLGFFWLHDYFRFGTLDRLALPNWNHLWFIFYLWAYTMILVAGIRLIRTGRAQAIFDRLFGGAGVLLIPIAWLMLVHVRLFPMVAETHRFIDDGIAHATYLPAFLFGFGLARSPAAMRAMRRFGLLGGLLALAGYGFIAWVQLFHPHTMPRWALPPYLSAHAVQQWGAITALIALADRFWNRDRPIRSRLTEAVFPFYIIHQTIIVLVGWVALRLALPGIAEFAALLAATLAGCWLFYLVGRTIPPLRPLIGLRYRAPPRPGASLAVR